MTRFRDAVAMRLVARPGGRAFARWYAFHRSRLHVVSYPKAGRTWLRFALGIALQEHFGVRVSDPRDLLEINRLARVDHRIPSVRFSHDDDPHTKRAAELERSKRAYRSKDVIFLVRDPRDVVVSSYHQHTLRAPHFGDPAFTGSISEFVRHPVFGIGTIIEFMNIWAENSSVPRAFEIVRYEDMMQDLERELRRVLACIGITTPATGVLRRAMEVASFENMRTIEREDALGAGRLRPADPSDPNSFKVRKGRVGTFAEELEAPDRSYVDQAMAALDPRFRYEVS